MERPDSLGHTATIRDLGNEAADAALFGVRILLTGGTGVGKQTLARLIHERTRGATAPLIVLDCCEISDSTFEAEWLDPMMDVASPGCSTHDGWLRTAHGGTIHIRSLDKMTSRKQAALFRHLDARHGAGAGAAGHTASSVDVRLITSGDTSLFEAVAAGRFRPDLFYRLNTVHLCVPPLCERLEEVPVLFDHFVREFCDARQCAVPAFAPETLQALTAYSWPGNVRELKQVAIRLATKGGELRAEEPSLLRQVQFESLPGKRPAQALPPDVPMIGTARPRIVARPRSAP
jgi:DNA-binding NtrC family response regulator